MRVAEPFDRYRQNPLVHRDRRLGSSTSEWARSFACDDMSVLIVCRGPIRKEAIEVFREMGMRDVGILLSEKDSIGYPRALSPELRMMEPHRVHPVPDYTGASKDERMERIGDIIRICREHGYRHVFAGYGFMAEDATFVSLLEEAGLIFIGPGSHTQRAAGAKDEAKRTAIQNKVSVTPGVNNVTALTLLAKAPDRAALKKLAKTHNLSVPQLDDKKVELEDLADAVLDAGYAKQLDLYTIDELAAQVKVEAGRLLQENPGRRFRLKAIGGGGGKGQRIFSDAAVTPGLVREVLSEVKATGTGDNKNLLIELNIESTRHNEIQIVGNGQWCIALGGRDCSLQMYEQKLVEVSITREELEEAAASARSAGNSRKAKVLDTGHDVLVRMEEEAERFGLAVGLDSASTFECIVEGSRHFFMEVNTRIQVEHRVSELCYALRFTNPDDADDFFDVHSLVEAMALIAKHRSRLPRPGRVPREGAAVEIRLNATDRALNPAAGGVIISWSGPTEHEIRDDQGISIKNPDTDLFMRYRLAGAYDSNIALLLTTGAGREETYARILEILRRTSIRGVDLATNLEFHFGIVAWFAHRDVWAMPTTGFVVPYLTAVGELAAEASSIDFDHAFRQIARRHAAAAEKQGEARVKATRSVLELKETLLERPLKMLIAEPHFLSAWLSEHRRDFAIEDGRVAWKRNPVEVLGDTYHLLHLDPRPGEPAASLIWSHDQELLDTATAFYGRIAEQVPANTSWTELDRALTGQGAPQFGFDAAAWEKVRAAHAGHQLGLEILDFLPLIAETTGFYDLALTEDLGITIPDRLLDTAHQDAMRKVLVPPPMTRADEIVATMSGTYFSQESPEHPPFVTKGAHFDRNTALYVIEVMKMFNKVHPTFAGTIDEVLVENGAIVRKGQPLFKVTPDEQIVVEDPEEVARRNRERTDGYLKRLVLPAS